MYRRSCKPRSLGLLSTALLGGLTLTVFLLFAACPNPNNGEEPGNNEDPVDEVTEYTVQAAEVSNGRIIAVPEKAPEGTEITLVLIPNVYYRLAAAPQVTMADETAVPLTEKEDAEPYTFTMPASDVRVNAGFDLNPSHNVVPIYNAADLAKIGADPGYPMNGVYRLEADFAVTDWTPIGEFPAKPFTGILQGNNKTITINSFSEEGLGRQAVGLFGYTAFAEMENLNLVSNLSGAITLTHEEDSSIAFAAYGSTVGINLNMIAKNITVEGKAELTASNPVDLYVGGIIGLLNSGRMENCAAEMEIGVDTSDGDNSTVSGGIAGGVYNFDAGYYALSSGVSIVECSFAGSVVNKSKDRSSIGGILGKISYIGNVTIQRCVVKDEVTIEVEKNGATGNAAIFAGGIVGEVRALGDTPKNTIESCTVGKGTIKATGIIGGNIHSGGIAGSLEGRGNVSGCASAADVVALFNDSSSATALDIIAGGIVGSSIGASIGTTAIITMNITNCFASGDVQAWNMGGNTVGVSRIIAGGIAGVHEGVISSCYATGDIEGLLTGAVQSVYNRYDFINVGGIAGRLGNLGRTDEGISDSYYAGDEVKATGNYAAAGGIAGVAMGKATIKNSYALGKVSVLGSGEEMTRNPYSSYNIVKNYSAGGIVGHLNSPSSSNIPKAEKNVAFNSTISVEGKENGLIYINRIVGNVQGTAATATSSTPGTPSVPENNLADSAMTITTIITGGATTGPETVTGDEATPENTVNGKGIASIPAQQVYTDLGWDFATVWKMGASGYPVLAWQN